jgi:Sec-independent protein translocase protein TatA
MDLNILGIGPAELLFFVVLLLLLFGPKDLARMARDIGRFVGRVTRSQNFQTIQQASQEIRNLPQRIVQEAQLEDIQREAQELKNSVAGPLTPPPAAPATIAPPAAKPPPDGSPFQAWTQELPAEASSTPDAPTPQAGPNANSS